MKTSNFSTAQWGNNIPELMRIHGVGVKDLADELEITVQAVYDLKKRGVIALTAQRAAQLQAALNTDYYKIFPLVTSDKD